MVLEAEAMVAMEAPTAVLTTGVAVVILSVLDTTVAEGTKGLASTLRVDPPANVGG